MQMGFPWWLCSEESACKAGDVGDAGSIPRSGRCPGAGHGELFQYSCLENPMAWGAWWATVRRFAKSRIWLKQMSMHTYMQIQACCINVYTYVWHSLHCPFKQQLRLHPVEDGLQMPPSCLPGALWLCWEKPATPSLACCRHAHCSDGARVSLITSPVLSLVKLSR